MSRSLLVALAALLWLSPAKSEEVDQLIAAGDKALTRFDLAKATQTYRDALKFDPENYEACWRLTRATVDASILEAAAAKKKRLLIEAQDYARSAVRLNPTGAKGHVFLSIVVGQLALYEGGRTKVELSKEVKTEADKALALNPKEALAYHCLGIWNREMAQLNWFLKTVAEVIYGKFPPASMDAALKNLRQAVELSPTSVANEVELGITLQAAGQSDEAKQTLERALTMPKTWVTDDCYKQRARETLKSLH
jgi:tetratricopeptide (TPR) repeat protein